MPLFDAQIAEIVRGQKKDDEYIDELTSSVAILAQRLLHPSRYARWQKEIALSPSFAYYAATTLCGLQTLGEEYVGLIQITRNSHGRISVPSAFRRLVFVILQILGPYLSDILLSKTQRSLISISAENRNNLQFLIRFIDLLRKDVLPNVKKFHLALFYIGGRYYHLSKRLFGVEYKSLRFNPQTWTLLPLFRLLGYISIVQILFSSSVWIFTESKRLRQEQIENRDKKETSANLSGSNRSTIVEYSQLRCQLCLEEGRPFACTPCGHPFCWTCMLEHVLENNNCPSCRSPVTPSRVIPLMNV